MAEYVSQIGEGVLRQRAREAEHSARIQAELANKIRSEFLSNMRHELRTPLNTVIGFSKIIADHGTRRLSDADIVEYAGIINGAAGHLLSVINDVLDISSIQAGRFMLERREVDLDEILLGCATAMQPTADQAGQTLRTDIAPDLLTVRGDPVKLRQIVNNILSNAVKFTPSGGLISLTAQNGPGDCVTVSISDTGVGMSEDDITIALTPFGQVDGSHSRWREGTGLGLPIANALTLMHEGELSIGSIPGQGTEVRVILPSADAIMLAEARAALRDGA